jgi:hypothetical protein
MVTVDQEVMLLPSTPRVIFTFLISSWRSPKVMLMFELVAA